MNASPAHHPRFAGLLDFLARVPSVQVNETSSRGFGSGSGETGWWVKFSLDLDHPLAWSAVQEFGHVLNYLSIEDRLPTVFMPVSPPPYMNGGPRDYLSWLIECPGGEMEPDKVAQWLEARLPDPVDDPEQWSMEDEED